MNDIGSIADGIERALRAGSPPRAGAEPPNPPGPDSGLDWIGAGVPLTRRTVKAALRARPDLDRHGLLALAGDLWARGVWELRLAAIEALAHGNALLAPDDLAAIEPFARSAGSWALIDPLALNVAAPLVERHPALADTLDRWATDGEFWVRRTAMLALLPALRRGGGDFDRFARYADAMLEEREFFIRKAIGWVLREVGKKRPALVAEWLAPRVRRASGVTFREAVKYLPAADRERLTAARRDGGRTA